MRVRRSFGVLSASVHPSVWCSVVAATATHTHRHQQHSFGHKKGVQVPARSSGAAVCQSSADEIRVKKLTARSMYSDECESSCHREKNEKRQTRGRAAADCSGM